MRRILERLCRSTLVKVVNQLKNKSATSDVAPSFNYKNNPQLAKTMKTMHEKIQTIKKNDVQELSEASQNLEPAVKCAEKGCVMKGFGQG